eukprot:gene6717-3387_t
MLMVELGELEVLVAMQPGPLFGGASMDAADAFFAPKLNQAVTLLQHFSDVVIDEDEFPSLCSYIQHLEACPEWRYVKCSSTVIVEDFQHFLDEVEKNKFLTWFEETTPGQPKTVASSTEPTVLQFLTWTDERSATNQDDPPAIRGKNDFLTWQD